MDIDKLNETQRALLKKRLIESLKETYHKKKRSCEQLISKYHEEYNKLEEENRLNYKELVEFNEDINAFKDLGFSLKHNNDVSGYGDDEKRIIVHLLRYEKKLKEFNDYLRTINFRLENNIKTLNGHANKFISVVNNFESAHNEGEFIKRLEIANDFGRRVVNADKDILDYDSKIVHKKEQIIKIIKKIIKRKHHLLEKLKRYVKKENHNLKKAENEMEKA